METMLQDLRYGFRTLFRTPGWTAMAIVTLALGVGATTAVFSFVDALLLREPRGRCRSGSAAGQRLHQRFQQRALRRARRIPISNRSRPIRPLLRLLAAEDGSTVAPIRIGDDTARIRVSRVSSSYFNVIGSAPVLGRPIVEGDMSSAQPAVAVISAALWQRSFGERSRRRRDHGHARWPIRSRSSAWRPSAFPGLDLGRVIDIWIPLPVPLCDPSRTGNRAYCRSSVVCSRACRSAKRRPSSRRSPSRLAHDYPTTNLGTLERPYDPRSMFVRPAEPDPPGLPRSGRLMLSAVLMGGVTLVLLLACANVASLFLARATTRSRELALRRALGATAGRPVRQLVTETSILGSGGGGAGVAVRGMDRRPAALLLSGRSGCRARGDARRARLSVRHGRAATIAAALVGLLPAIARAPAGPRIDAPRRRRRHRRSGCVTQPQRARQRCRSRSRACCSSARRSSCRASRER